MKYWYLHSTGKEMYELRHRVTVNWQHSLQEMSSNITEISDSMEEMDETFTQMSEEAQDGKDYAQESNNTAYDIKPCHKGNHFFGNRTYTLNTADKDKPFIGVCAVCRLVHLFFAIYPDRSKKI